jgi:Tol biopolymer transport system component
MVAGLFSLILLLAITAAGGSWSGQAATARIKSKTDAGATLLYTSGGIQNKNIWAVNADGTGDRALTTDNHSHSPSWSPDGRQILYIHDNALLEPPPYREGDDKTHHPVELQMMDRDGANVRLLRRFGYIDDVAWSPDGQTIAITCNLAEQSTSRGLFVLRANGQGEPRLLTADANLPTWSPDGKTILFASRRTGHWALYTIGADGAGEKQLTKGPLETVFSAWSPDGSRIAFDAFEIPPQIEQIYIMGSDASNLRPVTHELGPCTHPSWSQDGKQLAFSCETTPDDCGRFFGGDGIGGYRVTETEACKWRIFVISPDDPTPKLIPLIAHDAMSPVFAPK